MASPFNALAGKVGGLLDQAGRVHVLSAMAGLFTGKTKADDVPEEIQAMIGLFGLGDEIGFKRAMLKMSKGSQEIITDFIEWHFLSHQDDGPLGGVIAWYKLNKWRTLVVKLDAPAVKVGETQVKTTTPKKQGEPSTTTTDTKVEYKAGEEHTVKFLRKLVRLIKEGSETGKDADGNDKINWVPGYEKAVTYCAASGMATVNDSSILKWLDGKLKSVPDFALATPEKARNWVNDKHDAMLAKRSEQGIVGWLKRRI